MKHINRLILLCLFSFAVTSCSSLKDPEIKDVKNVEIEDVRIGKPTEIDVTADILIYNPNAVGLNVENTEFDVFLDDKFVTHITQESSFKLKAKEDSKFPIAFTVSVDKGDLLSNLGSLLGNLLSEKKMNLKTVGFVKVKVAGLPVKIPFEHVEPIDYGVAQSLQADYDMYDSLLNVTFGTVLGSGLHVGAGKLKDINTRRKFNEKITEGKRILGDDTETDIDINLYREYYPENSQIMKDLEATDPNTRKMLLQKALGDTMLDNPVDVTPIANADPILRNSTDSSPNPDISSTPRPSIDDVELKNLEDNIVNRNSIEQDAEIEALQSQLEAVRESQKDLNLKFEQGDSEIKLRTEDLDEVTTKSKELDEAIKDAINCVNGR